MWTFVPDEGVSLYTDDTTYLTFGWWLDKNAGDNPADFRAFSTASVRMGLARDASGDQRQQGSPYSRWYGGQLLKRLRHL